jgi:hypothetical protein
MYLQLSSDWATDGTVRCSIHGRVTKCFRLLNVQTGSGTYQASCSVGSAGSLGCDDHLDLCGVMTT